MICWWVTNDPARHGRQQRGVRQHNVMEAETRTRRRSIFYSSIALAVMACAIVSSFYRVELQFIQQSWTTLSAQDSPVHFRALGIFAILMFGGIIVLSLYRGQKMWRAASWETGDRTIRGLELKLEAAVVLGLGLTVFCFVGRGIV